MPKPGRFAFLSNLAIQPGIFGAGKCRNPGKDADDLPPDPLHPGPFPGKHGRMIPFSSFPSKVVHR